MKFQERTYSSQTPDLNPPLSDSFSIQEASDDSLSVQNMTSENIILSIIQVIYKNFDCAALLTITRRDTLPRVKKKIQGINNSRAVSIVERFYKILF